MVSKWRHPVVAGAVDTNSFKHLSTSELAREQYVGRSILVVKHVGTMGRYYNLNPELVREVSENSAKLSLCGRMQKAFRFFNHNERSDFFIRLSCLDSVCLKNCH